MLQVYRDQKNDFVLLYRLLLSKLRSKKVLFFEGLVGVEAVIGVK